MSNKRIQQLQDELKLAEEKALFEKQRADQAARAYEYLMHQYKELARSRFGVKSEKYIDPEHPQLPLFEIDEAKSASCNDEETGGDATDSNVIDISSHKRKKKSGKTPPRRIVIIPAENKRCACGCAKSVIRYETSEYYHHQPAVFELIEERREVVACPKGCERSITTAKKPAHILPKIKASHDLLAHVVVSKFIDRQPLYHLEKKFKNRFNVDISRRQMSEWIIKLTPKIQPLLNLLKDTLIDHDIAAMDATSLQVLKEPGRPATRKSYAYCFRGGPPDKKVVMYEYNAYQHKVFLKNWLEGFEGTIHSDADPFFDDLEKQGKITLSYYNAHARRKFEPIAKAVQTQDLAHTMMRYYRKLYRIEREAKNNHFTSEQRYKLRLEKSKPLLDEMKILLEEQRPSMLNKSPLAKAVDYTLKHWTGLTAFLDDGRLEIDNNLTEQEIKMFVIIRKNFLFANSVAGANALCAQMSLLRSAMANGLEPYRYVKAIFDALPHCQSVEDYEALLPWNINIGEASQLKIA